MSHKPTIYVVDPGRVGLLGHQYALNRMIGAYGEDAGYDVQYLVDRHSGEDLVTALNAIPILDFNIYSNPAATADEALEAIAIGNRSAHENVASTLADIRDGDVLVFHTISYLGLAGIAEWASKNAPAGLKVRILVRFPPGYSPNFQDIDQAVIQIFEDEFARGLKAWRSLDLDVACFGDSPEILGYLKDLLNWDVPQLPTSIAFKHCRPKPPQRPGEPPVFLLAGNGRKEKGILLLASAIEKFISNGGQGRFIIQSITNPNIAKLFDGFGDRVNVPGLHLEGSDYFDFLSQADAVLVPYDPVKYENRTSHVLIEGLGIGRPVITTSGTWMHDEAQRISPGSALFMADYSSDDLLKCLDDFCENRASLTKSAWSQAPQVREIHGESRFMETFLSLAG